MQDSELIDDRSKRSAITEWALIDRMRCMRGGVPSPAHMLNHLRISKRALSLPGKNSICYSIKSSKTKTNLHSLSLCHEHCMNHEARCKITTSLKSRMYRHLLQAMNPCAVCVSTDVHRRRTDSTQFLVLEFRKGISVRTSVQDLFILFMKSRLATTRATTDKTGRAMTPGADGLVCVGSALGCWVEEGQDWSFNFL
jgi:hypothetical protein